MSLLWTDGTYTSASAVSGPVFSCPIPGLAEALVLRQDFQIFAASYSPLALDTAHGTYADHKLAEESALQDLGGGVAQFTRTYAKIPSTHSEYAAFVHTFIGYYGAFGINVTAVAGRDRLTRTVPSRVVHEYFRCATGETYTSPGAIPIITAQKYLYGDIDVDFIGDSPPLDAATTPSRTAYEAWIAKANSSGWGSTTSGENQGQICAEDSQIERWMGNIWLRKTRYVLAQ